MSKQQVPRARTLSFDSTSIISEVEKTPLICRRFLENSHGGDTLRCSDLHTKYSFLWQVKMEDKWNDFKEITCLELESKYREPQIDGTHLNFPSCVVSGVPSVPDSNSYIDFDGMTLSVGNDLIKIRRLSTSSTAVESGPYCTTYNWYFEAWDDVWVRYGELLEPPDGEFGETATTSSDDIERQYSVNKKRSISTQCSGNIYDLDLVEMTQTNKQTNVVRRIRRRAQAGPLVPGLSPTSCPLPTEPKHTDKVDNSVASRTSELSKSDPNIESLVSALTSDEVMRKLAARLHAMQSDDNQHNKQQQSAASLLETPAVINKLAGGSNSSSIAVVNSSNSGISVSKCSHEWYFQEDNGSWIKYGAKTATGHSYGSDDVENYFKRNPAAHLQFYMDGSTRVINFTNMTETNTSTGRVRNVCRVTAGAGVENMAYSTLLLHSSDIEYEKCVSILGSCRQRTPSQVFKINNPYTRTAFENRKAYLQKQNPGVTYREELLFHGTKQHNIQSILEENIDWRLHGTNVGQRHGRGAYFSNSAQVSIGYGQVIFICKVLVGLTAVGNAGTVRPPKDRNNRAVDTTVNNVAKPTIFVKYCSEEYYPEYYVLF